MEQDKTRNDLFVSRPFHELPDVVIQDPIRQSTFYLPASELKTYEATPESWMKLSVGTVIFVIPDHDEFDELPPFVNPGEANPSILIQYRKERKAFFLEYNQLQPFLIDGSAMSSKSGYISFVIPFGLELVEELTTVRAVGFTPPPPRNYLLSGR